MKPTQHRKGFWRFSFFAVAALFTLMAAQPLFLAAEGTVGLEKLTAASYAVGYGGTYYVNSDGYDNPARPLQLRSAANGALVSYETGLCAHADAELVYNIEGYGVTNFSFDYGVNYQGSNAAQGGIRFAVYADDTELLLDAAVYTTASARGLANLAIPAGTKTLRLTAVAPNGINNAHALFANPRLTLSDMDRPVLGADELPSVVVGATKTMAVQKGAIGGVLTTVDPMRLSFASSNPLIASVDANGVVTGVSAGTAEIKATLTEGGYTVSITRNITVIAFEETWTVASPNGASVLTAYLDSEGALFYKVQQQGEEVVLLSPMGMQTDLADFSEGLTFADAAQSEINESYDMISGKAATYVNHCNETVLRFTKDGYTFDVSLRAYDDGAAYRYTIGRVDGTSEPITFTDETTAFVVPANAHTTNMPNGTGGSTNHEGTFSYNDAAAIGGEQTLPLLYETAANSFVLISEAALDGSYCGSVLNCANGTFGMGFPQQQITRGNPTAATMPWASPWRFAVTGSLENIIETQMPENLSPAPDPATDWSWVEPGVSAWTWMQGGKNAQRNEAQIKAYVDLASAMGWKYFILDEGWQPDNTAGGWSYEGYFEWFEELIDYAAERDVYFIAWCLAADLDTPEERLRLDEWAAMGIKGIKVDFFDRESQDRIQLFETLYQYCADVKLLVNCHGANKPTGQRRTYPNVLTREAIRGEEYNGNRRDQNVMLAYTRGVVGPADFTPRIYPAGGSNITTGQQLALNILLESGIPCMADSIANYNRTPGRSFLDGLPADWDQTEFVGGHPQSDVMIARRKGTTWYVGGATGDAAVAETVNLSFLEPGVSYMATVYKDNAAQTDLETETVRVTCEDELTVPMGIGGGFGIKLIKPVVFRALAFDAARYEVTEGETVQLNVVADPADYEAAELTFASADPSVAAVSQSGLVTAKKPGRVAVTVASTENPAIQASCEVVVKLVVGWHEAAGWTRYRADDTSFAYNRPESILIRSTHGSFSDADTIVNLMAYQPAEGGTDFDISAKIAGVPRAVNYQSFGVFIRLKDNPTQSVQALRRYHSGYTLPSGSGNHHIFQTNTMVNNSWIEHQVADSDTASTTAYIRLAKTGASFQSYYRYSEEDEWTAISTPAVNANFAQAAADDLEIGVFATNTNMGADDDGLIVRIESFRLNDTVIPFGTYIDEHVVTLDQPEPITVPFGTPAAEIGLPATLTGYLASAGTAQAFPVAWDLSGYDPATPGTYTLTGALDTGGLANALTPQIQVTVRADAAAGFFVTYTDKGGEVEVALQNRTDAAQTAQVVFARYDADGKLVNHTVTPYTIEPGAAEAVTLSLAAEGGETVRIFVWDAAFAPLAPAYAPVAVN